MRFAELKEGKRYKIKSILDSTILFISDYTELRNIAERGREFTVKDGLLYSAYNDTLAVSPLSFEQVGACTFEEIPQYVTFDRALEWMKAGGKAMSPKGDADRAYVCHVSSGGVRIPSGAWMLMGLSFLEPKWILMEEE